MYELSVLQSAAKKLAEVLLSSVGEDSYWPPLGPPPPVWLQREGAAASKDAIYPTVKPPQRYSTDRLVSGISPSLCSQTVCVSAHLHPVTPLVWSDGPEEH